MARTEEAGWPGQDKMCHIVFRIESAGAQDRRRLAPCDRDRGRRVVGRTKAPGGQNRRRRLAWTEGAGCQERRRRLAWTDNAGINQDNCISVGMAAAPGEGRQVGTCLLKCMVSLEAPSATRRLRRRVTESTFLSVTRRQTKKAFGGGHGPVAPPPGSAFDLHHKSLSDGGLSCAPTQLSLSLA